MSVEERLADWTVSRFIEFVASVSEDMAWAAGVGGRETAGAIISYLALKPEHIEPFLNGGIMELPAEWIEGGRLTWHSVSGKIVHPDEARAARAQSTAELVQNPQPSAQVRLERMRKALKRATINCGTWMREARRLQALTNSQTQALAPFADFARTFVDDDGWKHPPMQERIVDWFGPSEFRAAHSVASASDEEAFADIRPSEVPY